MFSDLKRVPDGQANHELRLPELRRGPQPLAGALRRLRRLEHHFRRGCGFVPGSVLLVGGDPGIGKSTLLLQAAAALGRRRASVVYVSGEEAIAQVRLRAERLGLLDAELSLAAETNVEDILATLEDGPPPAPVVCDSIH